MYDPFRDWRDAGLFEALWVDALLEVDRVKGLDMKWQAMDGVLTKAPLGGEKTGPNPTDRAKKGTKRSLLVEGTGLPIAVVVAPANRNDCLLLDETLDAVVVIPQRRITTHLCLDGGYNSKKVRASLLRRHIVEDIRDRRREIEAKRRFRAKPRRWKVERTHSWMNRYRRLLIRWEKGADSFLAMIHLACASICFGRLRLYE